MINCRQCDFSIRNNMRHALMNNCCPACGSAILGETHTQRMRLFKQRLMQQEFSQGLSEDLVFDISLFMLLEFSPINSSKKEEEESQVPSSSLSESQNSGPDESVFSEESEYEKIRDEIREEVHSSGESSSEDLDEELKIARLKRLAKESKVKMSGTAVRRLTND